MFLFQDATYTFANYCNKEDYAREVSDEAFSYLPAKIRLILDFIQLTELTPSSRHVNVTTSRCIRLPFLNCKVAKVQSVKINPRRDQLNGGARQSINSQRSTEFLMPDLSNATSPRCNIVRCASMRIVTG